MTPFDPDPLHVDDERIPSSKSYRLVPDSPRRWGCAYVPGMGCGPFIAVLAVLVILAIAAPRGAPNDNRLGRDRAITSVDHSTFRGAPQPAALVRDGLPGARGSQVPEASGGAPLPAVASAAIPTPAILDASAVTWEGTLAYALPSFGPRYLAIRQPRGSRVVVCGPAACLTRISTDFGPSPAMARQGRIADVSAADFTVLCGVPLSFGLCVGTLTLAGLPATDQVTIK